MSNSPLVSYTNISPNQSGKRQYPITRISPHCVVGQCSIEGLGGLFANPNLEASSNYGIAADGRVGMFVEEDCRSWCTSSWDNDQRAVTIECASDTYHPYAFKDNVYQRLIELCADICERNGKNKLVWIADKNKALNYTPASNEMLLTVHRWFANKACPGDWLMARMQDLADKVTARLQPAPAPTPQPKVPVNTPTKNRGEYAINYRSYITNYGWMNWVGDGELSGSQGFGVPIESIQIEGGMGQNLTIEYQLHIQKNGDSAWCKFGEVCGTLDLGRRTEAIRLKCNRPIKYRAYCQKTGWSEWKSNGEWAGEKGKSLRMEAIQIKLA